MVLSFFLAYLSHIVISRWKVFYGVYPQFSGLFKKLVPSFRNTLETSFHFVKLILVSQGNSYLENAFLFITFLLI